MSRQLLLNGWMDWAEILWVCSLWYLILPYLLSFCVTAPKRLRWLNLNLLTIIPHYHLTDWAEILWVCFWGNPKKCPNISLLIVVTIKRLIKKTHISDLDGGFVEITARSNDKLNLVYVFHTKHNIFNVCFQNY